jgi:hypothetical protein
VANAFLIVSLFLFEKLFKDVFSLRKKIEMVLNELYSKRPGDRNRVVLEPFQC